MTVTARRTNAAHPDFTELVRELDNELYSKYGSDYLSYQPHNALADIFHAVVVYSNGLPAACGGLKRLDPSSAELKRIYVSPQFRRLGLARRVIQELEDAALIQGFVRMALETGTDMQSAISLYRNAGYTVTENYGPYFGDSACICMEKILSSEDIL
jgi:putative acetyltransferase